MNLLIAYWPVLLIGVLAVTLLLYLLLRPRQRIALTDSAPLRPHMRTGDKPAAVTTEPTVAGPVQNRIFGASGPPDDLTRLKGVGPKLAAMLNSQGLTRFDQLAILSPAQIEEIDQTLGIFRGRLARDNVVDQSNYLSSGDIEGFEQRYGKL